jgi:hypothetical protein
MGVSVEDAVKVAMLSSSKSAGEASCKGWRLLGRVRNLQAWMKAAGRYEPVEPEIKKLL